MLCIDRLSLIQCLASSEQSLREILDIPAFLPETLSKLVHVKEIEFILKQKIPESGDNLPLLTESIEKCRKEIQRIRNLSEELSAFSSPQKQYSFDLKAPISAIVSEIANHPERFEDPLLKKILQPPSNKNPFLEENEQTPKTLKPSQFFADINRS